MRLPFCADTNSKRGYGFSVLVGSISIFIIYAPTPMSTIWPITSSPSKSGMYHWYDQMTALVRVQCG